jgi:general stress protein 26
MSERSSVNNIRTILDANLVGTLATVNEDGSPWATPVHVFADDTAVYWFSQTGHQHSVNIERDPRVSLALWARTEGTLGAYISGTATKLSDEDTTTQILSLASRDGTIPAHFAGTSGYCLEIGQLNRGKSTEKRWYFYS